jgi:tRNA (guanine37-N1)-methyltransferase
MVEFLENKPLLHAMMTQSIRRGNADVLFDRPDGVMIYDRKAKSHMLAAGTEAAAREMVEGIKNPSLIVAHDPMCRKLVAARFSFPETLAVVQAVYLKKDIDVPKADIRPLDLSHHAFVRAHYESVDDDGYVAERLREGGMYGVYWNGELAGFMGTHAEGSLGLLEILPEYRRRGLGEALERYVTQIHLARGWTPFSQIEQDNMASQALHRKLGFEISDECLYWFM